MLQNHTLPEIAIFIEEVNKNIFHGELTEIIEVTYTYRKIGTFLYFNTTLFSVFGEVGCSKKPNFSLIEHQVSAKLDARIAQIDYYIKRAKKLSKDLVPNQGNKTRLHILQGALKYAQNSLYMAFYGLPFELEKAGYTH